MSPERYHNVVSCGRLGLRMNLADVSGGLLKYPSPTHGPPIQSSPPLSASERTGAPVSSSTAYSKSSCIRPNDNNESPAAATCSSFTSTLEQMQLVSVGPYTLIKRAFPLNRS